MAQPNVPVSRTGHIPPSRLVRGARAMQAGLTTLSLRSATEVGGEHLMQSKASMPCVPKLPGKPGL
jgi:Flp pilus assembly protein CpaB